jgi:P-type Cu+ transporter
VNELVQVSKTQETEDSEGSSRRTVVVRLIVIAAAAVVSLSGVWRAILPFDLIAIAAALAGGYPVYVETFESLRHGHINMEVSMTLAIAASLLLGQFTVAVVITFFVLLSEFIESLAVDRGRSTILKLENSAPKRALVRRGGKEFETEVSSISPGEIVIVRDGERIPVDGLVVAGSASVNQSAITGESLSMDKRAGSLVYAGSVDESGVLEVRTHKVGSETVFGKIIKLVEEAEEKKAPIQKVADRLASLLVEFAIGFGLITFLVTRNIISTLSVIVVAGACGVAAGTPLALVAIIGYLAKRGVIVKGGIYLQELSKVDTVVIDKTGTLTFGEPEVVDVIGFDGYSPQQVLLFAASAERLSNHPLARAITNKAVESGVVTVQLESSNYLPGKGIVAAQNGEQIVVGNRLLMAERNVVVSDLVDVTISDRTSNGKTTVLVARGDKVCGAITTSDKIRAESKDAIRKLKREGLTTVMLTGDNKASAETVANEVGIDLVYSELLPQDKVAIIERLIAEGHRVAMVGDGVNDAPALARANVAIGMGAGTDIAIEEADIVLMTNDLEKIPVAVKASRRAYNTIMTNFYGTLIVDGIGITLAFLGFLNPLLAAGIHVVSELIFILNSARLIR